MNITLLTSDEYPTLIADDAKLIEAFSLAGHTASPLVWTSVDRCEQSALVVRSTWDYWSQASRFITFLEDSVRAGCRLVNPLETIVWNYDKRYLSQLFAQGLPVVPLKTVSHFSVEDLALAFTEFGERLVCKPLVGAGGRDTFLVTPETLEIATPLVGRSVIIQKFEPQIVSEGEVSLLFFGKHFSHAVLKKAAVSEFRVQERHGGTVEAYRPSRDTIEVARSILAGISHKWSYARVDLVGTERGFQLLELELIEPELFFRFGSQAEDLFVNAVIDGFC